MEKNLEVSIVNYLCPICGNIAEEGIIMNSLLNEKAAKEVKSLHNKTIGFSKHACKECAKHDAVYFIGIDPSKSSTEDPWRTGQIVGVKKDSQLVVACKDFIKTLEDGTTYCFIDQNLGKELGLWE